MTHASLAAAALNHVNIDKDGLRNCLGMEEEACRRHHRRGRPGPASFAPSPRRRLHACRNATRSRRNPVVTRSACRRGRRSSVLLVARPCLLASSLALRQCDLHRQFPHREPQRQTQAHDDEKRLPFHQGVSVNLGVEDTVGTIQPQRRILCVRRREFLAHAGRSALASALLPLHARIAAGPRAQRGNSLRQRRSLV